MSPLVTNTRTATWHFHKNVQTNDFLFSIILAPSLMPCSWGQLMDFSDVRKEHYLKKKKTVKKIHVNFPKYWTKNSVKLQPNFHAACLFLLSWLQVLGKQKKCIKLVPSSCNVTRVKQVSTPSHYAEQWVQLSYFSPFSVFKYLLITSWCCVLCPTSHLLT